MNRSSAGFGEECYRCSRGDEFMGVGTQGTLQNLQGVVGSIREPWVIPPSNPRPPSALNPKPYNRAERMWPCGPPFAPGSFRSRPCEFEPWGV